MARKLVFVKISHILYKMKSLPLFMSRAVCKHDIKEINSGVQSAAQPPGRGSGQHS